MLPQAVASNAVMIEKYKGPFTKVIMDRKDMGAREDHGPPTGWGQAHSRNQKIPGIRDGERLLNPKTRIWLGEQDLGH